MTKSMRHKCPYVGLIPFSEEDALFFFGRDEESKIIKANLMASRLTLLYGESGVGKSSVLQAAVGPQLRMESQKTLAENGRPEFAVVEFNQWSNDPIVGLSHAIAASAQKVLGGRKVAVTPSTRSLVEILEHWSDAIDGDLLIILDQFEDLFLYHGRAEGSGTFGFEFSRAVNQIGLRVSFLISIREDALAKLDVFKGQIPNLFDNYLRIQCLDREAARDAIEGPLEKYNSLLENNDDRVDIQSTLVDAVLNQVGSGKTSIGQVGRGTVSAINGDPSHKSFIETPYLQLVLTRLWDEETQAGSRALRLHTLDTLGGAQSIVRSHLDLTMSRLRKDERKIAARLFDRLVTPGGTKIALTVRDLVTFADASIEKVQPVLKQLEGVRVLRRVAPPIDQPDIPRFEIYHDVLAASILDWRGRHVAEIERRIRQKQFGILAFVTLIFLLFIIAVGVSWREIALNKKVVAEKLIAEGALKRAEEETKLKDQANARADRESKRRRVNELDFRANLNLAAHDHFSAALWFAGAALLDLDNRRREVFHLRCSATLRGAPSLLQHWVIKGLTEAKLSADGSRVCSLNDGDTIQMWDVKSGERIWSKTFDIAITRAIFSPNGKYVATIDADNCAKMFDAQSGELALTNDGKPITFKSDFSILDLEFSPDGMVVLIESGQNDEPTAAMIWEPFKGSLTPLRSTAEDTRSIESARELLFDPSQDLNSVPNLFDLSREGKVRIPMGKTARFSIDGQRVAVASGNSVRVWDLTGKVIGKPIQHDNSVTTLDFSPDNKSILTSSRERIRISALDGSAVTFDKSRQEIFGIVTNDSIVRSNFAPDGVHILIVTDFGKAVIWHTKKNAVQMLATTVSNAEVSPDGRWITAACLDKTVKFFDLDSLQLLAGPLWHSDPARFVAFSSDCSTVLTGDDNSIRVWKMDNEDSDGEIVVGSIGETGIASSDGRFIAKINDEGQLFLVSADNADTWEIIGEKQERFMWAKFEPLGRHLIAQTDENVINIWSEKQLKAFASLKLDSQADNPIVSSDGRFFACVSGSGVAIWDTSEQKIARGLNHVGTETDSATETYLCFSPNSDRIAIVNRDGRIRVCEVDSGTTLFTFEHGSPVFHATFSPEGALLVTSGYDNQAKIWPIRSRDDGLSNRQAMALSHDDTINFATFDSSGARIVTCSDDNTARIWDVASGVSKPSALQHDDRVTFATFSGDDRFVATSCNDGTVRVWDVDNGDSITTFRHTSPATFAGFTPGSEHVVTITSDHSVFRWPLKHRQYRPETLAVLSEVLSAQQIEGESDTTSALTAEEVADRWMQLRKSGYKDVRSEDAEERRISWHRHAAMTSLQAEKWFAAKWHLDHLITLQPNVATSYYYRMHALGKLSWELEDLGLLHSAEMDCRQALLLDPLEANLVMKLASLCIDNGDTWAEKNLDISWNWFEMCSSALSLLPPSSTPTANMKISLAQSYCRIGLANANKDQDIALRWLNESKQLLECVSSQMTSLPDGDSQSELMSAYRDVAEAYKEFGDGNRNRQAYLAAKNLRPAKTTDDARFFVKLGEAMKSLGELADAEECFRTGAATYVGILKGEPTESTARQNLSHAYGAIASLSAISGDSSKAIEIYQQSLANAEEWVTLDPQSRQAKVTLGWSFVDMAEITGAKYGLTAAQEWYGKLHDLLEVQLAAENDETEWQTINRLAFYEFLGKNLIKSVGERQYYYERILAIANSSKGDSMREVLSDAYNSLAILFDEIGKSETSYEYFVQELAIRKELAKGTEPNDDANSRLASVHEWLADICCKIGRTGEALSSGEECVTWNRRHSDSLPADSLAKLNLAWGQYYLAKAELQAGLIGQGLQHINEAFRIAELNMEANDYLAAAHDHVVMSYLAIGRIADAQQHAANEFKIREKLANGSEGDKKAQQYLVKAIRRLGHVHLAAGDMSLALRKFEESYKIEIAESDQDTADAKARIADSLENLAAARLRAGQIVQAQLDYERAVQLRTELASDADNIVAIVNHAAALDGLAGASSLLGHANRASSHYQESMLIRENLVGVLSEENSLAYKNQLVAKSHENLANHARKMGDLSSARREYEIALKLRDAYVVADPENAIAKGNLRDSYDSLGDVCLEQDQMESAVDYFGKALTISQDLDTLAHGEVNTVLSIRERAYVAFGFGRLGRLEMQRGNYDAAKEQFKRGMKILGDLNDKGQLEKPEYRDLHAGLQQMARLCEAAPIVLGELEAVTKLFQDSPDDKRKALTFRAAVMARRGEFDEVQKSTDRLRELGPDNPNVLFDLALCYSQCVCAIQKGRMLDEMKNGERDMRNRYAAAAIESLSKAFDLGFVEVPKLLFDKNLDSIRQESGYAELVKRVASPKYE